MIGIRGMSVASRKGTAMTVTEVIAKLQELVDEGYGESQLYDVDGNRVTDLYGDEDENEKYVGMAVAW